MHLVVIKLRDLYNNSEIFFIIDYIMICPPYGVSYEAHTSWVLLLMVSTNTGKDVTWLSAAHDIAGCVPVSVQTMAKAGSKKLLPFAFGRGAGFVLLHGQLMSCCVLLIVSIGWMPVFS